MADSAQKTIIDMGAFVCEVCEKLLKVPVIFVTSVGNVCGKCFDEKKDVMSWTGTPNLSLEAIMSAVDFRCKFQPLGCREVSVHTFYEDHLQKCSYNSVNCFANAECQWIGAVRNLVRHVELDHPELVIAESKADVAILKLNTSGQLTTELRVLNMNGISYVFAIKSNAGLDTLMFICCASDYGDLTQNSYSLIRRRESRGFTETFFYSSDVLPLAYLNIDSKFKTIKLSSFRKGFQEGETIEVVVQFPTTSSVVEEKRPVCYRCHSCKKIMKPPVYICSLNHSTCYHCKKKANRCNVCKSGSISRNYRIETVIMSSQLCIYNCKNEEKGCPDILSGKNILDHEEKCKFNCYKCPFNEIGCTATTLGIDNLLNHLMNSDLHRPLNYGLHFQPVTYDIDVTATGHYHHLLSKDYSLYHIDVFSIESWRDDIVLEYNLEIDITLHNECSFFTRHAIIVVLSCFWNHTETVNKTALLTEENRKVKFKFTFDEFKDMMDINNKVQFICDARKLPIPRIRKDLT